MRNILKKYNHQKMYVLRCRGDCFKKIEGRLSHQGIPGDCVSLACQQWHYFVPFSPPQECI